MGGTITDTECPYYTIDSVLYTVKWGNGQVSKHYSNGLFCIGRFQSLSEFEGTIKLTGPIELTLGPQDGCRHVKLALEYDEQPQDVEIFDRRIWVDYLEPLANKHRAIINTVKLPPKTRKKR